MRRLANHSLFWISYVFFKTYLNIFSGTSALLPESLDELSKYAMIVSSQLAFLLVKVPLVYGCFAVLDGYLDHKWRKQMIIPFLLGLFVLGIVGMFLVNHLIVLPHILDYHDSPLAFNIGSAFYHFFTLLFIVGVACAIKLFRKQFQSRLKETQLEKEKIETELKYLKGQINPHFLFNTLNNIYSLARKKSDLTAESVLKLSKLMRFMLYDASSAHIAIADELKLIEDYISLERLRYSDRLKISFTKEIDAPDSRMAPLLLIHFVENAFKHGAGESRFESSIAIQVILKQDCLTATIQNTKGDSSKESASHIGLENIRRQLELLYPKHSLKIDEDKNTFTVVLSIPNISGV